MIGLTTKFAPPERDCAEEVQAQALQVAKVSDSPLTTKVLAAAPDVFMILNDKRQVVYANEALFRMLGLKPGHCVQGQRPGELLGCLHATEEEAGCGCSQVCSACGAVQAILEAQEGQRSVKDCQIQLADYEALDLRVWASPLELDGVIYTLFAVVDISNEKRRRILERLFFHDIMNTAGNLLGYSQLLQDADQEVLDLCRQRLQLLAEQLVDEITAQRELTAAETGELTVHPEPIMLQQLLADIQATYSGYAPESGRRVEVAEDAWQGILKSDRPLLRRVIGNMVKNALEAPSEEKTVRVGAELVDAGLKIWVWNSGLIPPQSQLRIFQRSFSTKGLDRGLGTYSMKLFGEKYLQGEVDFSSHPEQGTTFWILLPAHCLVC